MLYSDINRYLSLGLVVVLMTSYSQCVYASRSVTWWIRYVCVILYVEMVMRAARHRQHISNAQTSTSFRFTMFQIGLGHRPTSINAFLLPMFMSDGCSGFYVSKTIVSIRLISFSDSSSLSPSLGANKETRYKISIIIRYYWNLIKAQELLIFIFPHI